MRSLWRMMRSSALVVLTAACADGGDVAGPAAPSVPQAADPVAAQGLLTGITGVALDVVQLPAVLRDRPTLVSQSASAVIGSQGGEIAAGGVVLRVPRGALLEVRTGARLHGGGWLIGVERNVTAWAPISRCGVFGGPAGICQVVLRS